MGKKIVMWQALKRRELFEILAFNQIINASEKYAITLATKYIYYRYICMSEYLLISYEFKLVCKSKQMKHTFWF